MYSAENFSENNNSSSQNMAEDFLGKDTINPETGELDTEAVKKEARKKRGNLNIVLMGATGTGKSSLINAVFGENIAKAGTGKPVTQHLEKFECPEKGLTLWDTKGIEAKDYEITQEQLKEDIKKGFDEAFSSNDDNKIPHIIWLCIKESYGRIEEREKDLLFIALHYNLPVVVILTDTLNTPERNKFYEIVKLELKPFDRVVKSRIVRVNSVDYTIAGVHREKKSGLENLLEKTEECFEEAMENASAAKKADAKKKLELFQKAQIVEMEKKKQAMTSSARNVVHAAAAAAAAVGASPIPGSDAPLIAAVQSGMIYKLNTEFEVDEAHTNTASIVTGMLGITAVAQVGKAIVSNALKFIPGVGTLAGAAISAATAAALTEAIGHAYIQVLLYYFDEKTGKTVLPGNTTEIISLLGSYFKNTYKK